MSDAITRGGYSPFREIERLRDEMNRVFNTTFGRLPMVEWHETGYPPVDVYATPEELFLVAEVPGLAAENIEITTTKDSVTIAGEFSLPKLPEQAEALRQERTYGKFTRSFRLPMPVDADQAEADIKDGLLIVRIPKAAEVRPRTIPIKAIH